MHVPAPTFRFEWNLNTIVVLLGLGTTIFTGGIAWANIDAKFAGVTTWISGHDSYHKERALEVNTASARIDERVRTVENKSQVIDNLAYRVTVNEQSTASINQTLQELKTQVGEQSTGLRVIQEILTRMERTQNGNTISSVPRELLTPTQ